MTADSRSFPASIRSHCRWNWNILPVSYLNLQTVEAWQESETLCYYGLWKSLPLFFFLFFFYFSPHSTSFTLCFYPSEPLQLVSLFVCPELPQKGPPSPFLITSGFLALAYFLTKTLLGLLQSCSSFAVFCLL